MPRTALFPECAGLPLKGCSEMSNPGVAAQVESGRDLDDACVVGIEDAERQQPLPVGVHEPHLVVRAGHCWEAGHSDGECALATGHLVQGGRPAGRGCVERLQEDLRGYGLR